MLNPKPLELRTWDPRPTQLSPSFLVLRGSDPVGWRRAPALRKLALGLCGVEEGILIVALTVRSLSEFFLQPLPFIGKESGSDSSSALPWRLWAGEEKRVKER